jgi:hypothetical protein
MADLAEIVPSPANIEGVQFLQSRIQLCPGLMFASVAAILCLGADASIVEQVDGLRRYMTSGEIVRMVGSRC